MNESKPKTVPDEVAGPATPEDVAILYSWANLPGAKYRDFSASRREYRAQQRAKQAENQRQAELARAQLLEEAAGREMEEARQALELAHRGKRQAVDAHGQTRAEEAFRQAAATASREREEAGRRQQSAETLRLRAQAARREMMDARRRAEEQAARYAEFNAQYREQADQRADAEDLPGQLDDPYYYTGQVDPAYFASAPGVRTAQATRTSTGRKAYVFPMHPGSDEFDAGTLQAYRPGTTFAPSPDFRPSSRSRDVAFTREPLFQRDQPAEQQRRRGRDPLNVDDAVADNEYYSNSGRGLETQADRTAPIAEDVMALGDLHIRPRTESPRFGEDAAAPYLPPPTVERRSDNRGRRNTAPDPRARTTRQPRAELAADGWDGGETDGTLPPAWLDQPHRSSVPPSFLPVIQPEGFPEDLEEEDGVEDREFPDSGQFADASRDGGSEADETEAGLTSNKCSEDLPPAPTVAAAPDTLQQSRERVAYRWFALQGLMDREPRPPVAAPTSALQQGVSPSPSVPLVAVVSLSGGVGKTSLVATLGRALSSLGEKVLLADTNAHGLLPYYFGARDLRPGAVRTFTPPAGSADAPVLMVHYALEAIGADGAAQQRLVDDLTARARNAQRVLVDLDSRALWLGRQLALVSPLVLVPLAPDMNSILSTQAMEATFAEIHDAEGQPIRPYYVLNQYDPALPLHLDVREVLRRSLGDRLLPVMIHRAPAVSEALAEGMTVIDYAPASVVTEDYRSLAQWMQLLTSADAGAPGTRWRER